MQKKTDRVCQHCQKPFQTPSYIYRKYCSIKCAIASRNGKRSILDRFWEKVHKTDSCWIWTGAKRNNGYGRFLAGFRVIDSHVFSYLFHHGEVPEGCFVCHDCSPNPDNPSCCNPDHLWAGTPKQNTADAIKKGRFFVGERVTTSKLKTEDVIHIRALSANGIPYPAIARKFRVSVTNVCNIVNRKIWRHVN